METIEALCGQVESLWREHEGTPFPTECLETDQGNALAHLDSSVSGCVSTFLERDYTLDLWRTASLGVGYRAAALAVVLPHLPAEALPYFTRLETLAGLILEVVGRKAKEFDDT